MKPADLTRTEANALSVITSIGSQQERETAAIHRAIADTIPTWLDMIPADEALLRKVFTTLEEAAKASNARKIASYPLRPKSMDDATPAMTLGKQKPTDWHPPSPCRACHVQKMSKKRGFAPVLFLFAAKLGARPSMVLT